jgi:hypothetical protein
MDRPALPLKAQHAAIQHSIDQAKANFDKNKELSNLLEGIREKCTKEINSLLGSKAKEYREFLEKSREIAKTMQPLFTATPEGREIKSQFQKTSLYEANKFMKNLGINVNDFKSILSKYQEESKSIIEETRTLEGSLKLDVSPIPVDVVHPDPDSPWHSIYPPYSYSHGEAYYVHSGSASAFAPFVSHYENYLTGEFSCHSQNYIHNAGDHAHQMTVASSIILIFFQMPVSGRLNIWTQLQCIGSSYWGGLWNYFGYSDATTMQSSRYFMTVGESLGMQEAYFRLLDYRRHTDDDVEWSGNMVMPNEYRTFNLVTDIPYSAGQWVPIRAGILDVEDAVCDDMSFFGEIKNSWILRGVYVSVISP